MKLVVDTNVIISGVFFAGLPHRFLEELVLGDVEVIASEDIIEEYYSVSKDLIERKAGTFNKALFDIVINKIKIVETKSKINVCRDPDDNKFLECAIDGNAIYIISGDQDLLTIKQYNVVLIITVADYYSSVLCEPNI